MSVDLRAVTSKTATALRRDWPALSAVTIGMWLTFAIALALDPQTGTMAEFSVNLEVRLLSRLAEDLVIACASALVSATVLNRLSSGPQIAIRAAVSAAPWLFALRLILDSPSILEVILVTGPRDYGAALLIGLAFLSSILIAIVFVTFWGMFTPTLIAERLGPWGSLVRANHLLKGARSVFVCLFVLVLFMNALPSFILAIPFITQSIQNLEAKTADQFGISSGIVYLGMRAGLLLPSVCLNVVYAVFVTAFYLERTRVFPSRDGIVNAFS